MSSLKIVPRKSQTRGNADHGWLKTFHSFAFAMYYDPRYEQWGPLRVLNEDRVAAKTGFDTHFHREFEIWSYVVSGQLEHKDSMKNIEILKRGDIQMTSAGTGISHSEYAAKSSNDPVHFLQIWAKPHTPRLSPRYFTRHFTEEEKLNKLCKVVAPDASEEVSMEREASGPAPVHSAVSMYATILEPGKTVEGVLNGQKGYIHLIQSSGYNTGPGSGGSIKVSIGKGSEQQHLELREGDGANLTVVPGTPISMTNTGSLNGEFVTFDIDEK